MSVVISGSLVLGDTVSGGGIVDANNPIIGYQTRVTAGNVSTTTAATGFPASNLANPSTNLRWQGVAGSPGNVARNRRPLSHTEHRACRACRSSGLRIRGRVGLRKQMAARRAV